MYLFPQVLLLSTQSSHLKLLISLADENAMFGTLSTKILDDAGDGFGVAGLVESEAETGETIDDGGAELGAALANAASEDEGVDAATKCDVIRANEAADAVNEYVECKAAGGIVGSGDNAEVGGARHGFPATLLVEDLLGD